MAGDPLLQALIAEQMRRRPSEESSGADRLRPPYPSPVGGAQPATAGAARILEVGYNQLPAAYQQAYATGAPAPLNVGEMPEGYNMEGLRTQGPSSGPTPALLANTPKTATHELIHELSARLGWRGSPLGHMVEEALARQVAGNPPSPDSNDLVERLASEFDQQMRAKYGETWVPKIPQILTNWFTRAFGRNTPVGAGGGPVGGLDRGRFNP